MFENTFVSLSGCGRLQDIGYDHDNNVCITLHLINECFGTRDEDLWIECSVSVFDLSTVAKWESDLALGKSITIKFDAQYLGFKQCYSGISENDPRFIVYLQAKLIKIHEYSIESDNIVSQYNHELKKHIVRHSSRA